MGALGRLRGQGLVVVLAGCDRVEIILPNGRRLSVAATTEAAVLARLIQVVERV